MPSLVKSRHRQSTYDRGYVIIPHRSFSLVLNAK
jgi:hypothetical protein